MKQLDRKSSPFQILMYIFTSFDSRSATAQSGYEKMDIKYGKLKVIFWISTVISGIILSGKL